jgi:glucuronosyltransferase
MYFHASRLSSYSHRIGMWPLVESLASRGHNVTFVSPFPSKSPLAPNITDLVPKSLAQMILNWDVVTQFYEKRVKGQQEWDWFKMGDYGVMMCSSLLEDQEFLQFLDNAKKFDLLVIDALSNECAYGIAYKLGAKIIIYNTADPMPWMLDPFGIPDEASWVPDMVFHPPTEMNIYHRFISMAVPLYYEYTKHFHYFPLLEGMLKEKLKLESLPSLADIERNNISLMFVNHHFAEDFARPFPPNVIPVGGLQLAGKPQKLPKVMQLRFKPIQRL